MPIETANRSVPRQRACRRSAGLPIHVLLVDDHPAVRRGIKLLISEQPDLTTIGEADNAVEAVGEEARWADVAVIDYHLGGRDGLWLARELQRRPRPPRVLIYSAFADQALTVAAIIAGADGLLSKTALDQELCAAIRRLAGGRQHFAAVPGSVARVLRAQLGHRDQAIFDMLLHGIPAEVVAARLGIASTLVEARREAILEAIAPRTHPRGIPRPHAPLDYDRARRRPRYRAA
ncbi:MAG: response regulator [Solirubrobacteraceae bacterium]